MAELVMVFRDRFHGDDDWCVEWTNDGKVETTIFRGLSAHERPIRYADQKYARFNEVDRLRPQ
jgi:hypothetical protein